MKRDIEQIDSGPGSQRAVPASSEPGPESAESMASSVTRHTQISEGPNEWEFLAANVDTLDLMVYLDWGVCWSELAERLDQGKESAKDTGGVLFEGGDCLIMPGAAKGYRWHLKFALVDIFLRNVRCASESTPNVKLALRSQGLWWNGVGSMTEACVMILKEMGGTVASVVPSRVDIAADFNIPGGLTQGFLDKHRVPVTGKTAIYSESGVLETYTVGASASAKKLRIYNKTLEIATNGGNNWFYEIWPIDPPGDVWRFEFQLRREVLRRFKIDSVEDLKKNLFALWLDLTSSFFSLRLSDNSNTTRRTLHPLWEEVQAVSANLGMETERQIDTDRPKMDASWFESRIIGWILGAAIRLRIDKPHELIGYTIDLLEKHWDENDYEAEYRKRSIKLGFEESADFKEAA